VAAIVIADGSPLIVLARENGLLWLQQLFTQVVVTEVVLAEVLTGRYPETEIPMQARRPASAWR
jgi:predicted nucleic acid-binding protein